MDLESPAPEEILLNLDSQGQARGGKKGNKRAKVTLRPLTDEELQKYHMEMLEPTQRVQKGHFVWVWYSTPVSYSTLDSDNAISKGRSIGANDGNTATESHVGVDGSVVSSSEVLVDTNDGTSLQRYRQQQQQQQQPNRNQQSNSVVETSVEMLLGNPPLPLCIHTPSFLSLHTYPLVSFFVYIPPLFFLCIHAPSFLPFYMYPLCSFFVYIPTVFNVLLQVQTGLPICTPR